MLSSGDDQGNARIFWTSAVLITRFVCRRVLHNSLITVPPQCETGFTAALLGDIDATVHHVVGLHQPKHPCCCRHLQATP